MKTPIAVIRERFSGWSRAQRRLAAVLAAAICVLIFAKSGRRPAEKTSPPSTPARPVLPEATQFEELYGNSVNQETERLRSDLVRGLPAEGARPDSPANRLITRAAELAVATEEFVKSRSSLEEILERHRGYAARLRMTGQPGGSMLSATLRVPSTELNATVSELKSLGRLDREEQTADEVTEQRADLEARLSNAESLLRRLKQLLEKQSYPDGNVRDLERQIANASAEVARLEAERRAAENRVTFANVNFTLREQIPARSESLGAELRGAAQAGFGDALASLAGLLVFLIERGPVTLLWCAILYLPARLAWRKWQPAVAGPAAAEAK
jgi:hypothetical protein